MLGWTPADLKIISDEYLSTSAFQDQASEELKPLLSKYDVLGRELCDLAWILEKSARPSKSYQDPELDRHIREAKQELQEHLRNQRAVLGKFRRSPLKRLSTGRIARLLQQANDHLQDARNFKIGFLLDTRFESLKEKEIENGSHRTPQSPLQPRRASQAAPSPLQRVHSASDYLQVPHTEDHDTGSLVDDATGALRLARVVWKNMADISSKNPDRHRSLGGRMSAKQQYVNDIAELIKKAELYAAGIDMLDEESRRALEEIVSKAIELKHTRPSPAMTDSIRELSERRPSSGTISVSYQTTRDDDVTQRTSSLTGEWLPYTPLQLPESAIVGLGVELSVGDNALQTEGGILAMAPRDLVFASRPMTPSKSHDSRPSSDHRLSQSFARLAMRNNSYSSEAMQGLAEHGPRGWVMISSSQLRLPPTSCMLSVDGIKGEVDIHVALLPPPATAISPGGSDTSRRGSSNPTSLESDSSQGSIVLYSHKFKHFLKPNSRSVPTVRHPKYEGPEKSPAEPFTIAFFEAQLVAEEDPQERHQMVADLKYTFSNKEYRDEIRALMFGKSLLVCTGVAKIEFSSIACTRQSISLWDDRDAGCKTITFFRDNTSRKQKDRGEVEYKIIGIEESKRSVQHDTPIVLYVELLLPRSSRQRCSLYFSDAAGRQEFFNVLCPS